MTAITARGPRATTSRPWITVKEAAAYLGVGIDTIYDACARRGLKHVKIGHSTIRLKYEWIDEWINAQTRQNA